MQRKRSGQEFAKKAAIGAGMLIFGGGVALGAMATFEKLEVSASENLGFIEHPTPRVTVIKPQAPADEIAPSTGPSLGDYVIPMGIVAAEIAGATMLYRRFSNRHQQGEFTAVVASQVMDGYTLSTEDAEIFDKIARSFNDKA